MEVYGFYNGFNKNPGSVTFYVRCDINVIEIDAEFWLSGILGYCCFWFSSLVPLMCSAILMEVTTNFANVPFNTQAQNIVDAGSFVLEVISLSLV